MTWVKHAEIRNVSWEIWKDDGDGYNDEAVHRAILLDIREELRRLNALLYCENFLDIPYQEKAR